MGDVLGIVKSVVGTILPGLGSDDYPAEWQAFARAPSRQNFFALIRSLDPEPDRTNRERTLAQFWNLINGGRPDDSRLASTYLCNLLEKAVERTVSEGSEYLHQMMSEGGVISDDVRESVAPLLHLLKRIWGESSDPAIAARSGLALRFLTYGEIGNLNTPVVLAASSASDGDMSFDELVAKISSMGRKSSDPGGADAIGMATSAADRLLSDVVGPAILSRDRSLAGLAHLLGYGSHWDHIVDLNGIGDPRFLIGKIDHVMKHMSWFLKMARAYRRSWRELRGDSIQRMDAMISEDRVWPIVRHIFENMGLSFSHPDGRDFEMMRLGSGAQFASKGRVMLGSVGMHDADNVTIMLGPGGGFKTLHHATHEGLHAVHASRSRGPDSNVWTKGSSHAFVEGMALLLDGLFCDPLFVKWLVSEELGLNIGNHDGEHSVAASDVHALVLSNIFDDIFSHAGMSVNTLFSGTHYSASFRESIQRLMEKEGASEGRPAPQEIYRFLSSRAGLGPHDSTAAYSVRKVNPAFVEMDYVRGKFFAAAMSRHLRERFGREWFRNPDVGPYLTAELFMRAEDSNVEDVVERMVGHRDRMEYRTIQAAHILESGLTFISPQLSADSVAAAMIAAAPMNYRGMPLSADRLFGVQSSLASFPNMDLTGLQADIWSGVASRRPAQSVIETSSIGFSMFMNPAFIHSATMYGMQGIR